MSEDPIDFVIAWVDGSEPAHRARLMEARGAQPEARDRPRRWENNDEISLCLASMQKYAPWVRRVFIVTDRQAPQLQGLDPAFAAKISIADHREIYHGHEDLLPVFNSLSIETMLWRLPELAEQFVYFNDDMFLAGPCAPSDFFVDGDPVLRGDWRNGTRGRPNIPAQNKIEGARLAGYEARRFFSVAHVGYTAKRSTFAAFFTANPEALRRNAAPKFREGWQFAAMSLHANLATQSGFHRPVRRDWLNLSVWLCNSAPAWVLSSEIEAIRGKWIKLGCINDANIASTKVPQLMTRLRWAAGLEPMWPLRPEQWRPAWGSLSGRLTAPLSRLAMAIVVQLRRSRRLTARHGTTRKAEG